MYCQSVLWDLISIHVVGFWAAWLPLPMEPPGKLSTPMSRALLTSSQRMSSCGSECDKGALPGGVSLWIPQPSHMGVILSWWSDSITTLSMPTLHYTRQHCVPSPCLAASSFLLDCINHGNLIIRERFMKAYLPSRGLLHKAGRR